MGPDAGDNNVVGADAGPRPDAKPSFTGPCEGDAQFVATDGTCYEYFFQGGDWDAARVKCQLRGGDLAIIEDDIRNGVLASLVPTAFPNVWLRGTDAETEGSWTWAGEAMTFTKWRSGEPNNGAGNGNENCMILESNLGGSWDDRSCSDINSYICQRDNVTP